MAKKCELKLAIEDLRRLKESASHKPISKLVLQWKKSSNGNQQQLQQCGPASCAMIPKQQNFTRHDERLNFSTMFSGCQIGQVHVTSRATKQNVILVELKLTPRLEVLPSRTAYFEHLF